MTDYNKLKVVELRELLKEKGIPATGLSRKQQIIEALEAHDADNAVGGGGNDAVNAIEEKTIEEGEQEAAVDGPVDVEPEATTEAAIEPAQEEAKETEAEEVAQEEEASSPSSETRKRKRRSVTPPVDDEVVQKKLKAADEDELPTLPEDVVVEDATSPAQNTTDGKSTDDAKVREQEQVDIVTEMEDIVPTSTSDQVIPSQETPATSDQTIPVQGSRENVDELMDIAPPAEPEISVEPPSTHPPTRSIYIRELLRPLQPTQLRDHIATLASSTHESSDIITTFHLDTIRTHAFVTFTDTHSAIRVRAALHNSIWPDEPSRKPLWVDFIPDDKVSGWIERETDGGGRRDFRRWEVEYGSENGSVTAELTEVPAAPPTAPRRHSSGVNPLPTPTRNETIGQGMPNAPLGPRLNASQHRPQPAPTRSGPSPTPPSSTFATLDTRFPSTTTKPKLYYLPCPEATVSARLKALESVTSSTWDERLITDDRDSRMTARERQLRRYTFEKDEASGRRGEEDEDKGSEVWKVVDGGVDIGTFGRQGGGDAWRGGRGGGGRGWR